MKSIMYVTSSGNGIVSDGFGVVGCLLHDVPSDASDLRLKALVASGDYFATLAARLEQVAAALPETSVEQYQLQDTVGQLLSLQRDYVISKRSVSTHL